MRKYPLLNILLFMLSIFTACSGNSGTNNNSRIPLPDYQLIWFDEFDEHTGKTRPDITKWWYETGGGGWGNNELQYYVAGTIEGDTLAYISEGTLKIKAIRLKEPIDNYQYASIRMNTKQAWKYGYFEAKLKLPEGYGTWPAFWMLPEDFKKWPLDGEIDIMEHAGNVPDSVHITVHTQKYNHSIHTQISSISHVKGTQEEFHVYGVEWTEEFIKGYIDGEHIYTFENDKTGNQESWPFDKPFYLKLNLALGGFFSNQHTVDDNALPALYEIDYVRVYQKK